MTHALTTAYTPNPFLVAARTLSTHGPVLGLVAAAALAGCQPASSQPRTAFAPDTQASERQYGSALTVGLRITTDPQSDDEQRVRIVAVVRDIDGVETTTEVGDYEGTVTQQPVQGNELVRVHVDHEHGSTLVLRPTADGGLEVHHQPDSGEHATVRRIPLRDNAAVQASDPAVVHTAP